MCLLQCLPLVCKEDKLFIMQSDNKNLKDLLFERQNWLRLSATTQNLSWSRYQIQVEITYFIKQLIFWIIHRWQLAMQSAILNRTHYMVFITWDCIAGTKLNYCYFTLILCVGCPVRESFKILNLTPLYRPSDDQIVSIILLSS